MDFEIISPWVLLGLRGLVTLAGVMMLIWIGRVWLETQLFGMGGFIVGLLGLAAALGGVGGLAMGGLGGFGGMEAASAPEVAAIERQLQSELGARKVLEEKLSMQGQQILALEKDLSESGEGARAVGEAERMVITGADPKSFQSGWILTFLRDDGSEQPDTFEFVRTRKANAPLKTIKGLIDKDMWQRIQDGKVKARRAVILKPEKPAN